VPGGAAQVELQAVGEAVVQQVDGFTVGLSPHVHPDEPAVDVEVGLGGHRRLDGRVAVSCDADACVQDGSAGVPEGGVDPLLA
jgi:hypothetical protein